MSVPPASSAPSSSGPVEPVVPKELGGRFRYTRTPAADPAGASPGRGRVVRWRAGDAVEAWMGEMVRHRGVVEEPALQLGVVWIREQGTGMRILIDLNEAGTELRHPDPPLVRR